VRVGLWSPTLAEKSSRMGCRIVAVLFSRDSPAGTQYRGGGVVAWPSSRASSLPWDLLDLDFLLSLLESMRLMRLSVKKAAYAGVPRAAYKKSWLMAARPAILGNFSRRHLIQTGFPASRNWTPSRVRLSVRKAACS
jgi:hypothetical protein